ncbi:beta-CASP ribonuclease aCPSF1 [archaeon]|nr:beta-CASP ribonuclease aCPSF1 [archaeon]
MVKYEILSKVMEGLPGSVEISEAVFEGANIILYSKNKDFVLNSRSLIKKLVNKIKKRIEVRPDPSIHINERDAKSIIKDLVPKDAGLKDIWFDDARSIVLLEADNPGMVIGYHGEVIKSIREKTLWVPVVRRAPVIKSDIVKTIRYTLYKNSEYRRKMLHNIGKRIYGREIDKSDYWVRLSCLGGAREVGRSCFLLQTPESKVMLDCGVNVASEDDAFPYLNAPEVDIKALDAVIISHSHLDHCGLVPLLFKYGYKGPVYSSEPTRDISTLLQLDYVDIAQREGKKQIYDSRDIKELVKHSVCFDLGEVNDVTHDVRLSLFNAGHVLGSSLIHLNIGDGYHNLLYTGDFKFTNTKMLPKAISRFQRVETLMLESTYGSSSEGNYPPLIKSETELINKIKDTVNHDGKILIPVLGVGRAQEIMLIVEEAIRQKRIPDIPVHVDGMVWDVTAVYTTYPEFMNDKVKNLIFNQKHNPFTSKLFHRVGSAKEREEIIQGPGPCIILATSGMLTGGSSVEYFRHLAENPDNRLILVSFQGAGSLGRRVQAGERTIRMQGRRGGSSVVKVRFPVDTISGFSGHSSWRELVGFAKNLRPKPKKVITIHGEGSRCIELASKIYKTLHVETVAPRNLDVMRIR